MTQAKLRIELVPKTCWYTNVRSNVPKRTWDILRRRAYRKAKRRCEICGGKGEKWPVECHEIWHYDDGNYVQRLKGLIALCPFCHEVKHIGLASLRGRGEIAIKHLAQVNGWSKSKAEKHVASASRLWQKRSKHEWTLNLSWLDQLDIPINKRDLEKAVNRVKKNIVNTAPQIVEAEMGQAIILIRAKRIQLVNRDDIVARVSGREITHDIWNISANRLIRRLQCSNCKAGEVTVRDVIVAENDRGEIIETEEFFENKCCYHMLAVLIWEELLPKRSPRPSR